MLGRQENLRVLLQQVPLYEQDVRGPGMRPQRAQQAFTTTGRLKSVSGIPGKAVLPFAVVVTRGTTYEVRGEVVIAM